MLFMELTQNMMRAARAPAPTSGAAVAMTPIALELELDAVPVETAEEALLAPDEAEVEPVWFEDEAVEDVPFPAEDEVKIVVIPAVEVYVVLLSVTVVRIADVVIATAPAEPEEVSVGTTVLAATPAPELMLV
jgi:hypothetical protein